MRKATAPHFHLLAQAARSVLQPMGLLQKGRSRTWLDDHGWWVCVVEFQPSSWSRGSYLNVGCNWLWFIQDYRTFDQGSRVEDFHQFTGEAEFEIVARSLVKRAASEVARYRELFPSVGSVAAYYLRNKPVGFWTNFHAAIACALSGRANEARRFLGEVTELRGDNRDWVLEAQADATQLSRVMDDPAIFRKVIAERVLRTRELQKLPPVAPVDFDR